MTDQPADPTDPLGLPPEQPSELSSELPSELPSVPPSAVRPEPPRDPFAPPAGHDPWRTGSGGGSLTPVHDSAPVPPLAPAAPVPPYSPLPGPDLQRTDPLAGFPQPEEYGAYLTPETDEASVDTLGRPVRDRRSPGLATLLVAALVIALIAGGVGGAVGGWLARRDSGSLTDPGASLGAVTTGTLSRSPDSVAGIAQRVLPTVVSIDVSAGTGGDTGRGSSCAPTATS
jgi:putative serine protease PepD